ncbi:MAG: Holliday junction branch migration protein RuvA [Candidatus Spechtbacteria bacterium]|nr:Holliday junction branch migration protein RuvA [Candidatus Spechtbacteria bacterium]
MIGFLRGKILEVEDNAVLCDVQGVGYRIFCVPRDIPQFAREIGQDKTLYTFHYIRETVMELYGFPTKADEQMFRILLTVSGIGPKGAMGILNAAPVDTLQRAIASGDTTMLTRVSGIGNKIAQKVVLELKDKYGEEWGTLPGNIKEETDVLEALATLGYSRGDAQKVLRALPEGPVTPEEKIKAALKILGGR